MSAEISHNPKYPVSAEHVQRMQDVLLVSSFALWAMLIGLRAGHDLSFAAELSPATDAAMVNPR